MLNEEPSSRLAGMSATWNSLLYVSDVFGHPLALDPTAKISFINVYTYSKGGLYAVRRAKGMNRACISGFTPSREFYAPKYEDLTDEDWKVPDLRSLIYWNPNVKTNKKGEAKVNFYNADTIGDMLLVIEGMNKKGQIGYYETSYRVNEKLEK